MINSGTLRLMLLITPVFLPPSLPSLRSSPPLLPAPPRPSSPPADCGDVAGRSPEKREALWDAGGLCLPANRGRPTAADRQAEESAAAGAESQGLYPDTTVNV